MNPAELLHNAKAVIFDFDGPICSVFAGYPANDIAKKLAATFETPETTDPFEVLRHTLNHDPNQALAVHHALEIEELKAVPVAAHTPGAMDLLHKCVSEEKLIAIASNNSVKAVNDYLRNIDFDVKVVSGRDEQTYDKMKPEPDILLNAVEQLGVQVEDCVFIGDSTSDLETAQKVDMPFIGYANKTRKLGKLGEAQITTIRHLTQT